MFCSEFLCHISWCLMTENSEAGSYFACTIVSKLSQNSLVYEEQSDTVNFLFFSSFMKYEGFCFSCVILRSGTENKVQTADFLPTHQEL